MPRERVQRLRRCRCCGSPSRGGCAARASAARARSRGARRRRWSRPRSGRASGAGAPRWRRRSRTTGRRSRAGCPAAGPRRRATSTPHSPGGRRTPSVIGSTAATESAPASCAAAASASRSSTAPRKFGFWTKTAAVSSSSASASSAASVSPPSSPTSTTSAPKPRGVGRERLAAVRVQAARDDELAASLGRADRQVGGRGDRRRALVERGVGDRQRGELGDRGLELEHHLQAALGDLGLVRRVRGQELRALGDRVDDRRHVVVVHPGAEEADLGVGVGVARRERREVVEDSVSESPSGRSSGRPRRRSAGMSANSSSIEPTPIAASIASRSASVADV